MIGWCFDYFSVRYNWLYVNNLWRFRVSLQSIASECQGGPCSKQTRHLRFKWSNVIRIHNHLIHKQTFNHLGKLFKWLNGVVSTSVYVAFDCMLISCHVHVLEWICTLRLPECQQTPCSSVEFSKWSNVLLRTKWFVCSNPAAATETLSIVHVSSKGVKELSVECAKVLISFSLKLL